MSKQRFKQLGTDSFYGEMVYQRAVPEEHFLRELEQAVDWAAFTEGLLALYKGKGRVGRPPYDPAVMLKLLSLAYLYDLSARATHAYVNDSLSAKWFLGLAVDEPAPSHSTLRAFKRRITRQGGADYLQKLLDEVGAQAAAAGVPFSRGLAADSMYSAADA